MPQIPGLSIRQLESIQGGMVQFYTPQSSHETMLLQIPAKTIDQLFVHHFQTDQLLVVRGSFVLVALENRQYRYIALSEDHPQVVTIPPGVPHSAINLSDSDCFVVNALLRHGPVHQRDYRPLKPLLPYDLEKAQASLNNLLCSIVKV